MIDRCCMALLALCMVSACQRTPQDPVSVSTSPSSADMTSEPDMPATEVVVAPVSETFRSRLALQGVQFEVRTVGNRLFVVPSGLEIANDPVERELAASATDAEVADLDADGSPELYVYLKDAGDPAKASLAAWASNRRKSLSEVTIDPLENDPVLSAGYRGGDAFAVIENRLARRFPLYTSDGTPTGKMRQIAYRLQPGEAGWRLVVDGSRED